MSDLSTIFKALSDRNRLAIYKLIRERCEPGHSSSQEEIDRSVSRIAEEFDLSLSTVSHHLKELKNAGLIRCERRGQRIYCTTEGDPLEKVAEFVGPAARPR